MNTQLIGYVRVSSKDQNEERQVIAMQKFGVQERNIFTEKMSGKSFNRPVYQEIIKKLKPNDTLVIKSIDRLGRNYNEIIEQWRYITKELNAAIAVIDMPLLDTRQKDRDLTASFVADIVLQILSYVAETERAFNRQRQAEGIQAAKARGVKFGRKPLKRPGIFNVLYKRQQNGEITSREAGHLMGVSHTTFLNWTKEYAQKNSQTPGK